MSTERKSEEKSTNKLGYGLEVTAGRDDPSTTDQVIAQLTDMFGETFPPEQITDVCKRCNWNRKHAP